ncbi:protein draper-like [Haliotis rubra]|uniref:protein draper-like n=1 Tax=Haliotis rubra TaxID=36100 RepID=UPI001EE5A134|nr:protein draper-like [Haliotis rubra]
MGVFLTTMLFFSITGTPTDAACHCNTAAACAVFPSSPCSQVGCQDGWFGSYCQRRNIAIGQRATQSSTFTENSDRTGYTDYRFEARYGVDGRATTNFYSKPFTCTHTATGDKQPTWTVHLSSSHTDKIQHIKLYLRDGFLDRNKGMKINVGGQLCFQWSTDRYPPASADVKCQQALTGNTLIIQTSEYLALCEVQIFVCSDGWFGEDCDKQCHCFVNTEICDKITGQCLSGCAPGYMGTDCQTECPDGYYGNCTTECGNCLNAADCNKTTGICLGDCEPGWLTDTCLQPCEEGYYGDCTSKCGNCYNAACCNKDTGICPGGCAAGWLTGTCLQPCQDGRYGMNCASHCGNCLDGHVCNKSTGMCPRGCAEGWMNDTCVHPCPGGYYGTDCTSKCGNCLENDVCNKSTGICPNGCAAGWINNTCHNMCDDGRYGSGCTSGCGHCKSGTVCDRTNGICGSGCDGGYSGARCEQCPATSGHSNQVVPVAATLGTLLILALIALLTAIIYIRRLKNQLGVLQKKPEDNYISLDERTKDPVVENTYEQINNSTPYVNMGEDHQGRI